MHTAVWTETSTKGTEVSWSGLDVLVECEVTGSFSRTSVWQEEVLNQFHMIINIL